MRIDVNDVGSGEPSILDSEANGACSSHALGVWLGDVVTIRGQARAALDTKHGGTARGRELSRLEHEHTRTLAHDETIAVNVVRA